MMKEEILDGFWDFSFTGETQEYKGIQSAEYSTKMPVPADSITRVYWTNTAVRRWHGT